MKADFQGRLLVINGKSLEQPFPIAQLIVKDNLVLVRLGSDSVIRAGDKVLNRNVYAYDSTAKLLWQIQEAPNGKDPKSYTNLYEVEGKIVAYNWTGVDYVVNLRDGTVQPHEEDQRPW